MRLFRPPLNRLSYRPVAVLFRRHASTSVHEKRPDVLATPSLLGFSDRFAAERHKRRVWAGLFAPSMVSRSAEYPVPMRSWTELGRNNIMEGTFPAKSDGPSTSPRERWHRG